ncbi:MAG: argininosuccinate synthase [Chloroflexota bacterium]|nr:argininosuccinate synthase [Chloroflexota bacterium]
MTMTATLSAALTKVEQTEVPRVRRVALAYSGGLDSALCVVLLREKYGAEQVIPITVDVGQGQEEIDESFRKAKLLGIEPMLLDAKQEFTSEWLTKAIRANSSYNGYPVSTSMTRQLIAAKVAQEALALGCDAIAEGSSGKGNDQYRMHKVFKLFAPELEILVPVRDFDLTRGEELELCEHFGVPVTEIVTGGDDKTMWCRSIASGAFNLNSVLPDDVWLWYTPPLKAPDEPANISLTFEAGVPRALDGQEMPLEEIIDRLNVLAGTHGIGKIDMFEDGIMDMKSREVYEAPAAQLIIRLHQDLEQWTLTKDEIQFKKIVDAQWAYKVYHGEWYHPLKADLDAFIERSQGVVSGTYTVRLYKGTVDILERHSQSGLFYPDVRSISSSSFNQQMCGPAAQVMGLPWELLARREREMQEVGASS